MSADNGIRIKKKDGKFEVFEYCASTDHETFRKRFDDLEAACIYAEAQQTEYGISYVMNQPSPEGETWPEMLNRLRLMAAGDDQWDLSDNDRKAIGEAVERLSFSR